MELKRRNNKIRLCRDESRHKGFILHMNEVVKSRRLRLEDLLASGDLNSYIKQAGRFAGRRPGIHIETGLLPRVNKAGFSHLVTQFNKKDVDSSFDISLDKAEELMTEKVDFTGDFNKLAQATQRVTKACKFPVTKFRPVTYEFAAANQVNRSASSGYPDFQKKGKVLDKMLEQAHSLTPDSEMWLWPQTRGFRLQIRPSGNTVSLKTRVMYPYPGAIILLEDTFIYPFVQHFIATDTFYVIGNSGLQLSRKLRRKLEKAKKILMSDFSNFDQSLLVAVMNAGFSVVRSQLQLTYDQSLLFEQMVAYCCTALLVSKSPGSEAYGFIKYKGMPSGSGFTNMLDTLCHAIMLEYVYPGILEDCYLCGDDNIMIFKNKSVSDFKKQFKAVFNMTVTDAKTKVTSSWTDIEFLGFRWKDGVRLVNTRLVINQALWHSDFRVDMDYYERHVARCASIFLNGKNGKDIFAKIFPDVMSDLRKNKDVRFTYLYNTQPAVTLPGVTSYTKLSGPEPGSSNESLSLHLEKGWEIR